MQARRILAPGQKGTKKFLDRYGAQLVCVRYRYDQQRRKRFTTAEIIVEESGWAPPEKPAIVGLRVELREIHYDQAVALGLKKRIVKLEVSDAKPRR